MFKKILVPLDGSDLAERILDRLEPILQLEFPEIHLLRVVQPLRLSEYERKPKEAREYMETFAKSLSARRARVITHVETGDPADVILDFVASNAVSLVAMSTHGTSGPSRWIRGSVAERVLRHCHVPLLMANLQAVQTTGRLGFQKVLVPLDGSETATQILPLVRELASHYESEIVLLCVEAPQVLVTPMAAPPPRADEGELAAKTLEPYVAELRAAGLSVRPKTAVGPAAEWILKTAEAEQVDLLAMTTHGRSGPSRWLFGSVAEKVLRKSPCPLLVRRIARTK